MIDLETRFHQPRLQYSPYRGSWRPARFGLESLSRRELEVVKRVAHGKFLATVAIELGISSKTASTHKVRAMQKLGINNDMVLSHFLLARGVIKNLYADEPNG